MHGNSRARLINIWIKQVATTSTTMQTAAKLYSLVVRLLWHTVEYTWYFSASQNVAISTVNVGVEERERKVIHSKECSWKEWEIFFAALVMVNPFLSSIVSRVFWLGGRFRINHYLISVEDDHLLMCLFYYVIFCNCAFHCLKKDQKCCIRQWKNDFSTMARRCILTMGSFQVEGKSLWRQDGGAVEEEQRLVRSFKETSDQKISAVLLAMAPVCIEGGKMGGGLLNNGSAEMSGCFRRLVIGRKGGTWSDPGRKWDDSENKEVFVIEMLCAKSRLWLPLTELLLRWTPLILV